MTPLDESPVHCRATQTDNHSQFKGFSCSSFLSDLMFACLLYFLVVKVKKQWMGSEEQQWVLLFLCKARVVFSTDGSCIYFQMLEETNWCPFILTLHQDNLFFCISFYLSGVFLFYNYMHISLVEQKLHTMWHICISLFSFHINYFTEIQLLNQSMYIVCICEDYLKFLEML